MNTAADFQTPIDLQKIYDWISIITASISGVSFFLLYNYDNGTFCFKTKASR